jgi:hypothetical protein
MMLILKGFCPFPSDRMSRLGALNRLGQMLGYCGNGVVDLFIRIYRRKSLSGTLLAGMATSNDFSPQ